MATRMGVQHWTMFGLLVNGRPVMTEFTVVDSTRVMIEVPQIEQIQDVAFFMLPNAVMAPDQMACLYLALPPATDWHILTALTPQTPSVIARVRWATQLSANTPGTFGISLEPLSALQAAKPSASAPVSAVVEGASLAEETKDFAKAIATDLFRFLDSFGHSVGPQAMSLLDSWFAKFARRMDKDPSFWRTISHRD